MIWCQLYREKNISSHFKKNTNIKLAIKRKRKVDLLKKENFVVFNLEKMTLCHAYPTLKIKIKQLNTMKVKLYDSKSILLLYDSSPSS